MVRGDPSGVGIAAREQAPVIAREVDEAGVVELGLPPGAIAVGVKLGKDGIAGQDIVESALQAEAGVLGAAHEGAADLGPQDRFDSDIVEPGVQAVVAAIQ